MRFDPFREFDRVAEQVFAGNRVMPRVVPMEAYRRGDQFFVHLDLPGVSEEDVDLTIERNVVSVRAHRGSPRQDGDELLVDERPHGEFTRQLFLGENLDPARLTASYDRGVLTLTIPVAEESKPRRVRIGGGAATAAEPQQTGAQPAHA
nr:Hsp20/alpha crystallin family protein [Jiangella muralis]